MNYLIKKKKNIEKSKAIGKNRKAIIKLDVDNLCIPEGRGCINMKLIYLEEKKLTKKWTQFEKLS